MWELTIIDLKKAKALTNTYQCNNVDTLNRKTKGNLTKCNQ